MNPQPKIKTPRDSKYLAFCRTLPCANPKCKNPHAESRQSHHTETGSQNMVGSDYSALPLCLDCHQDLHQHHAKSGYWKEQELKHLLARIYEAYRLVHPIKGEKA